MPRFLLTVYFIGLFVIAMLILSLDGVTTEEGAEEQGLAAEGASQQQEELPAQSSHEAADYPPSHSAEQPLHSSVEHSSPSQPSNGGQSEHAIRTITSLQSDFEQPFLELGYKAVYDAVRECEFRFMKKLNLPIYTPPVAFTHQLGRCDARMNEHDKLQIDYLHEDNNDLRYSILIKPAEYHNEYPAKDIVHTYSLLDGTEAHYVVMPGSGYHVLSFTHDNWQYILAIPNQLHERVQPEELVRAANSIRTYYPWPVNLKY